MRLMCTVKPIINVSHMTQKLQLLFGCLWKPVCCSSPCSCLVHGIMAWYKEIYGLSPKSRQCHQQHQHCHFAKIDGVHQRVTSHHHHPPHQLSPCSKIKKFSHIFCSLVPFWQVVLSKEKKILKEKQQL